MHQLTVDGQKMIQTTGAEALDRVSIAWRSKSTVPLEQIFNEELADMTAELQRPKPSPAPASEPAHEFRSRSTPSQDRSIPLLD